MWLWENELRELGFRRKGERYWLCGRRFGLHEDDHLSVVSWCEQTILAGRRGRPRYLIELTEFHVTLCIGHENVHFYFHESGENEWGPAGHTSSAEIRRLGHDPCALQGVADRVAGAFVAALGGVYSNRERSGS
jgi:hypothetical protein